MGHFSMSLTAYIAPECMTVFRLKVHFSIEESLLQSFFVWLPTCV